MTAPLWIASLANRTPPRAHQGREDAELVVEAVEMLLDGRLADEQCLGHRPDRRRRREGLAGKYGPAELDQHLLLARRPGGRGPKRLGGDVTSRARVVQEQARAADEDLVAVQERAGRREALTVDIGPVRRSEVRDAPSGADVLQPRVRPAKLPDHR